MELNKTNMRKIMLLIAFGIALYLGLMNLYRLPSFAGFIANVFMPVILGFVVAYVFNVLHREIDTHAFAVLNRRCTKQWPKFRKSAGVLLSLLIIAGIIVLVVLIIVPDLVNTVTNISNNIPAYFKRLQEQYNTFLQDNPYIRKQFQDINIDWSSISQMLAQYVQQFTGSLVGYTILLTANIFNGFVTFILGFVISINILLQKDTLKTQTKRFLFAYLPRQCPNKVIRVLNLTNQAFSDFIAGQCLGALILGLLCFIGMLIFGFPFALLISVFAAILSLIPILGQIVSVLLGFLLIFTVSPIQALWFAVYFIILLQVDGNLIYPKIVGSKMDLPTLWVLIAITLGGNLFGVVGMLVSIPIFSVFRILLSENIKERLAKSQPDKSSVKCEE